MNNQSQNKNSYENKKAPDSQDKKSQDFQNKKPTSAENKKSCPDGH